MSVHSRIPMERSIRQADRSPVSSYEQAVWRLVALREDPKSRIAHMTSASLIADIYWRTDTVVRRDAMVLAKQLR